MRVLTIRRCSRSVLGDKSSPARSSQRSSSSSTVAAGSADGDPAVVHVTDQLGEGSLGIAPSTSDGLAALALAAGQRVAAQVDD